MHSAHKCQIGDGVYVSTLCSMSLAEYAVVRRQHCFQSHVRPCSECDRMIEVATAILDQSFCILHEAFKIVSPTVEYTAS